MLPIERLEKIKEYIVKHEFAGINDLAAKLGVSTATVRRNLKQLEQESFLYMTRGGAALAKHGKQYEPPYMVKRQINAAEKRQIAAEAAKHLERNQTVFLDSSSTVFEMTRYIAKLSGALVATNDVLIAAELTNAEDVTVSVIGGTLRKGYYTLTGYFAEQVIKDLAFDVAFLGMDTVSLRGGFMITNSEEVYLKRQVAQASSKVIVLVDHSKFELESFVQVCGFDKVDTIITGEELADDVYARYLEQGIDLVRA